MINPTEDFPEYSYGIADPSDELTDYSYGGINHNSPQSIIQADVTEPFLDLLQPARYKVFYGGRGSGKSWAFARALIMIAVTSTKRILCCREYQSSIGESVHYVLVDQIYKMGLIAWFQITNNSIICPVTGSEFIFKGLRLHIHEIKSTEGVDICWIEEGQAVSTQSFNTLDPTIRKPGSEIWISYNPLNSNDTIHEMFVGHHMPEFDNDGNRYAIVKKVNWSDNPWFPADLEKLRLRHLNEDQDIYAHIWEGETLQISDAMVFKGKWTCRAFKAPEGVIFRFGADWGFATDPSVLIRCYEHDDCLWVDYEACGPQIELDELAGFFAGSDNNASPRWHNDKSWPGIPGAQAWPIKGDNSRPETISFLARFGLNITAAEKWPGSVEDGIAHLRAFKQIIIHPRCTNLLNEAFMYRYKIDRQSGLVLPVIVDAHNHSWDALRYSLDGYIQQRGEMGMWKLLGRD